MVDLFASLARGDVSGLVAILLAALFALLLKTWSDLGERLKKGDKALTRLAGFRQNHELRLVRIEEKVGVETIQYDPDTDNE